MRSIADQIEAYFKQLIQLSQQGAIEVQRSEIAQQFACVPSQINYVLTTRFSPEQGYLVESRRGGGGFLRIIRLEWGDKQWLLELLATMEDALITQQAGEGLLARLLEEGFLTKREALLMQAIISRQALPFPQTERALIRAGIFKAMLKTLLRDEFK